MIASLCCPHNILSKAKHPRGRANAVKQIKSSRKYFYHSCLGYPKSPKVSWSLSNIFFMAMKRVGGRSRTDVQYICKQSHYHYFKERNFQWRSRQTLLFTYRYFFVISRRQTILIFMGWQVPTFRLFDICGEMWFRPTL